VKDSEAGFTGKKNCWVEFPAAITRGCWHSKGIGKVGITDVTYLSSPSRQVGCCIYHHNDRSHLHQPL
jgi:hypothetical protein